MKLFKDHPFPVLATFEKVVALSFAFPEATIRLLVPPTLAIDTFQGFGFVTVAMVWTRRLRPAGFPAALGQDFFLAGYRIFTRLHDTAGRTRRGLLILRSETDKGRMAWLGNLMTEYNYRHIDLAVTKSGPNTHLETSLPDGSTTLCLTFNAESENVQLPIGSPFEDWRSARRFAGPMPFTFSPQKNGSFLVIEGTRAHWVPKPVAVVDWRVSLFDTGPLSSVQPILANAFSVEGVSYRWNRGQTVWPGNAP